MKNIKLISVLFISSIIISCEKDSEMINSNLTKSEKNNRNLVSDKSESDPFEVYGTSHNNFLDFVALEENFDALSHEEIYIVGQQFSDENFTYDVSQSWSGFASSVEFTQNLITYGAGISDTLIMHSLISSSEAVLVDSLVNIFESAVNHGTQTVISTSEFINRIESLEDFIDENYTIVYDESSRNGNFPAMILSMCSVAKSSYAYWMEVAINSNHAWYNRFENSLSGGMLTDIYSDGKKSYNVVYNKSIFTKAWHALKTAWVDTKAYFKCPGCGTDLSKRVMYGAMSSAMI